MKRRRKGRFTMPLSETFVIDQITVLEDGQLQIRRSRRVYDGAEMIGEQYHRHVLAPGDDLVGQDARVSLVANLLWTPAVVQTYRDNQERNRRNL
jgi:hypothetical protein